jgi:hypothetical protein
LSPPPATNGDNGDKPPTGPPRPTDKESTRK